jgi:hypothetical protein
MAPSSLLGLNQNHPRAADPDWSDKALLVSRCGSVGRSGPPHSLTFNKETKMRTVLILAAVSTLIGTPLLAKTSTPRIGEPAARATALARVKDGEVKANELMTEHGRLIYSYDISQPGKNGVSEVKINARTGKVVSIHHESVAAERAEAAADAKVERARHK